MNNTASISAPNATELQMLAQLEKIRQWDVKWRYTNKKNGGADPQALPPAL